MEKMEEYPEKAKEETRTLLRKLLAADDVARMGYRKGELTGEKASKFVGTVAVVVDGIMLEALRNKEIAEAIAPIFLEKIENGWGHPAPWAHILQILAYWHGLEIDGEVEDPTEILPAYDQLKSRMDLDNVEEEKSRLEKELKGKSERHKEERGDNLMFC